MRKGTYVLFMTFRIPHILSVGTLGPLNINAGEYCYIGSAMNGLDSRIMRHLSGEKKMRWHIDRLTIVADGMEAYTSAGIGECGLARIAVSSGCVPVFKGFGSSDCECDTHLFAVDGHSKEELLRRSAVLPFSYDAAASSGTRSRFLPR
ncbi:MAG: GIY-YIG nuclease family protein [Methanomassiliicoccaceae archaeon]|jgi:Uri superfamily endonuclease|nr:GIY-YIG nuclease family protein [Methanomassiliicoccaceae archaeon]